MAFLNVEDLTGTVEVVVFPRTYLQNRLAIRVDEVILVKGKLNGNGEDVKIIAEEISTLDSHLRGELHLKIDSSQSPVLDQVQLILSSYKGESPVFLHLEKEKKVIKTGEEYLVDLSGPVVQRLEELLGQNRVKTKKISPASAGAPEKLGGLVNNLDPVEPSGAIEKAQKKNPGKKTRIIFSLLDL